MRTVYCNVLRREAEGLAAPPYPGALGERIYREISREGWQRWLERLAAIMNENRLSTDDPRHLQTIEHHMRGFLFDEGDYGHLPGGFQPRRH